MKFYKDVLLVSTLSAIENEVLSLWKQKVWAISSHFWQDELLIGTGGNAYTADVSNTLGNKILDQIDSYLPVFTKASLQYYLWSPGSSIARHKDESYNFGATLYLNDWSPEFGGMFMWMPKVCDDNYWRGYSPQTNTLVVNDEKEEHFVTPVSPSTRCYRYTIQIWGEE